MLTTTTVASRQVYDDPRVKMRVDTIRLGEIRVRWSERVRHIEPWGIG